ncbi:RDD family protein [Thiothrix nivea]|uniref:RDD domain-containing protein n=1 Tax=Thiothrix nivea (strain ATCC 35100 / DSM 5205 / JP2) TaxID=870187 RepID=A0A656HI91_THINJ|nr:RDD family protein [Thiothrix nivea]EIJ36157.1 hypothetical protein Thini_3653 [Thiothrix nivea DSM 5205]
MKANAPFSTPVNKGYFLNYIASHRHGNPGMRLLALAFDLVLVVLLVTLAVLCVFGQTWLLYHAVYTDAAFYVLMASIPTLYFAGFQGIWGATPGKMLLLPWL